MTNKHFSTNTNDIPVGITPKVTLFNYTRNAVETLIFTKHTRLEMNPDRMAEIMAMDEAAQIKELAYMSRTLPSSWEFVDYHFLIRNVTRAFTHQLVRTRNASYAQQAMRIADVSGGFGYMMEGEDRVKQEDDRLHHYNGIGIYHQHMTDTAEAYARLIELGWKPEEARGLLPTNVLTNICMKVNLRTLAELVSKRGLSARVQGEYRTVLDGMYNAVIEVHPWAPMFLDPRSSEEYKHLEEVLAESLGRGTPAFLDAIKSLDKIRSEKG